MTIEDLLNRVNEIINIANQIKNSPLLKTIEKLDVFEANVAQKIEDTLAQYASINIRHTQEVCNIKPSDLKCYVYDTNGTLLSNFELSSGTFSKIQNNVFKLNLDTENLPNEIVLLLTSNGELTRVDNIKTVESDKLHNNVEWTLMLTADIRRDKNYYRGFDLLVFNKNNNLIEVTTILNSEKRGSFIWLRTDLPSGYGSLLDSEIETNLLNNVSYLVLREKIIDDIVFNIEFADYVVDEIGASQLGKVVRNLGDNTLEVFNSKNEIIKKMIVYRIGDVEIREPVE